MQAIRHILVTDPSLIRHASRLEAAFPELAWSFVDSHDEARLSALLADAEVFVGYRFTERMGRFSRRLVLLQISGAGTDEIALDHVPASVWVTNTYRHERSIAEYVVMTVLALSRDLLRSDARLREGMWTSTFFGSAEPRQTLRGKCLGLVGFGHIGREVAALAVPLGLQVAAIRQHSAPGTAADHGLAFLGDAADLDEVLARADFLVLAAPLNQRTRGMIGERELGAMKESAYLINVARAGLVVESELYKALSTGRIAGAALDVWYRYPVSPGEGAPTLPSACPFHLLDNVLITPHSSGDTEETFRLRVEDVVENLRLLRAGQPLINVVRAALVDR